MNAESPINFGLTKAVLNKAAELYVSSQVSKFKNLTIDINCEPQKLVRGQVDSIDLKCQELIIPSNISIKKIHLKSDRLIFDLLEIMSGSIKLKKPSNIAATIILSSADCERLLNSKYLATVLERLPIKIDNRLFTFNIQHARCQLKGNNKLTLSAELVLANCSQIAPLENEKQTNSDKKQISEFEIALLLDENGRKIIFEGGRYRDDRALSIQATIAVIDKIKDLLYFRHFTSPSLNFEINAVRIEAEQLILDINATVNKLPDSLESSLVTAALEIN